MNARFKKILNVLGWVCLVMSILMVATTISEDNISLFPSVTAFGVLAIAFFMKKM